MEKLNEYLQTLLSSCSYELHLEPNKTPYVVADGGARDIANAPLLGTQISMLVFPLIPAAVKRQLPDKTEVEFVHSHALGKFNFHVKKSPAGFNVTIRPLLSDISAAPDGLPESNRNTAVSASSETLPAAFSTAAPAVSSFPNAVNQEEFSQSSNATAFSADEISPLEIVEIETNYAAEIFEDAPTEIEVETGYKPEAAATISGVSNYEPQEIVSEYAPQTQNFSQTPAAKQAEIYIASETSQTPVPVSANPQTRERMDALFYKMAELGASDLHLSASVPPMIRKDGRMQRLEDGAPLAPEAVKQLLESIMPAKNREEFALRRDTDFAYEIENLARFRANIFMDRKGMGAVFRIVPTKILTAEQLGLSKAITDLCALSKGLVVVTGPTGSGKSTTLSAMIDSINKTREDHIITIEDPIEFVHENQKCLVNQREVHNHTESFKDALRAALREDPDIVLVGEMRDLETISIAIETAETGHLVFGTLHTTTAASTVDRIIDQFPADRQQQIRVMLSESLKGVIAQTLVPKRGGGRIAALEILIVTPAISNLIREGKTFQIPSAMQIGKASGMVMLNDALVELVKKGLVEPQDAYLKAVDKANFESLLTRNGMKL